jgi:hypothetical protein
LDPGKRANHLFHFSIQAFTERDRYSPNQAVALLANPVFVVLPLRQVCLVNVQQLRKLRLGHIQVLAKKPHVFALQSIRLAHNGKRQRSHEIVQARYDNIVVSAPRTPGNFDALQHHVSQPTLREWVTPSNYAGGRAASGAFSLPHFFPLASIENTVIKNTRSTVLKAKMRAIHLPAASRPSTRYFLGEFLSKVSAVLYFPILQATAQQVYGFLKRSTDHHYSW